MQLLNSKTLITASTLLSIALSACDGSEFAYVSLDGEKRIAVFSVNEETGELSPRPDVFVPSPPGALTTDPPGRFLFASLRRDGRLASFRIKRDGGLTLISVVDAGADPAFIATDRSGRFLLTAYYVASKITVHRIGEDGTLGNTPEQEIATAEKAHAIMTDRSNRFAFVPHTGPNAIYQFRFNAATGRLSPGNPLVLQTGNNTGPRQFVVHPDRNLLFFDYEQGSAIASFRMDQNTGQLTFRERLSSLPADFTGRNSNARIEIHPSGKFVYVANRGHDSLAGYQIDADTGRLKSLGQTATEPTPRGFAIDPSGEFLYAAGQSSNRLAAFRIDQKTGSLERFATYAVGEQPWWVHVLKLQVKTTEKTDQ